jgi:Holliday junction resolvase
MSGIGARAERDLCNCLFGVGFQSIRAPSSGSAPRPQPDMIAAREGSVLAAEAKAGKPPNNVTRAEADALAAVRRAFVAAAVVAVRYKGERSLYLTPTDALSRTPSDHLSIPSDPSRLPWAVALRYDPDTDGYVTAIDGVNREQLSAWVRHLSLEQSDYNTVPDRWTDHDAHNPDGYEVREQ